MSKKLFLRDILDDGQDGLMPQMGKDERRPRSQWAENKRLTDMDGLMNVKSTYFLMKVLFKHNTMEQKIIFEGHFGGRGARMARAGRE